VNDRERWATFDCYGTLVDWNAGIAEQLGKLFGSDRQDRLLARYHEVEPQVQAERPEASYREVLATALERTAEAEGETLPPESRDSLAESLPGWPVFPEVPEALEEARGLGWRLAILSNTDRDFIEASMARIGVLFDLAIVASEIGSYKPAHGHWEAFFDQTGADRGRHVHVAASLFHDIGPCVDLGIPCVWINRLGEERGAEPTAEQPDLRGLRETLDGIVPPD
jgi:2-haloacid dehalogenase